MRVSIKTIGDVPLPQYQTAGSVAFDIAASERTVIASKCIGLVPTGLIVEVPKGYMLHVASRSSTPKRKGLLIPHGMGILDQDYCGDSDQIFLQFYNFTEHDTVIEKGERVGQGVFVKIERAEWDKKDKLATESRGGFGSTGH